MEIVAFIFLPSIFLPQFWHRFLSMNRLSPVQPFVAYATKVRHASSEVGRQENHRTLTFQPQSR
jgi:hypothetical protein